MKRPQGQLLAVQQFGCLSIPDGQVALVAGRSADADEPFAVARVTQPVDPTRMRALKSGRLLPLRIYEIAKGVILQIPDLDETLLPCRGAGQELAVRTER